MLRIVQLLSLVLLLAPGSLRSQDRSPVNVSPGFVNGIGFREMPSEAKLSYVVGHTDALLASEMFGASARNRRWLGNCVEGWDGQQLLAIAVAFLEANPQRWNQPMSVLFIVYVS